MYVAKDISGQQFGELYVIKRSGTKNGAATWLCQCSCGNTVEVRGASLKNGHTKTCGHNWKKRLDLIGKRFGKLTVIAEDGIYKNPSGGTHSKWKCQCDCGNVISTQGTLLTTGHTTNCGCVRREKIILRNTTHGKTDTRLYRVFRNMVNRCYVKSNPRYKNYGGRGIQICDEWLDDYSLFEKWALENGYDEKAKRFECTIDRINVNGNYEPNNCRFVPNEIQANNKRTNRYITLDGKTKTVSEWAKDTNLNYSTIIGRLYRGWDETEAITKPLMRKRG